MAGLCRDAEVTAAGPWRERRRRWLSGLLLALLAPLAAAGEAVLPGSDYDPAIPRLDAVVGHGFGDDITRACGPHALSRSPGGGGRRSAPGWSSTPGAGRAGRSITC